MLRKELLAVAPLALASGCVGRATALIPPAEAAGAITPESVISSYGNKAVLIVPARADDPLMARMVHALHPARSTEGYFIARPPGKVTIHVPMTPAQVAASANLALATYSYATAAQAFGDDPSPSNAMNLNAAAQQMQVAIAAYQAAFLMGDQPVNY